MGVVKGKSVDSSSNGKCSSVELYASGTAETETSSTMESQKAESMQKAGDESVVSDLRSAVTEEQPPVSTVSPVSLGVSLPTTVTVRSIQGLGGRIEFFPRRTIDPFDPALQPKMVEAHSSGT